MTNSAKTSFDLVKNGEFVDRISLSVSGDHNVSNALAALAVADLLDVNVSVAKKGLKEFHGTDRRFEYKGETNGVTIIDDYAHHPTEIAATLTAATHYPHREIWCIFRLILIRVQKLSSRNSLRHFHIQIM